MNIIIYFLPILLLTILYVFIFTHRGETKRFGTYLKTNDWLTFFGTIFAASLLSHNLRELDINIFPFPWVAPVILILFCLIVLIIALYRIKKGSHIIQRGGDERMDMIYAKSGRNALFTTYLIFMIHNTITEASYLNTLWYTITLAGGLIVLVASVFFYYYRKG